MNPYNLEPFTIVTRPRASNPDVNDSNLSDSFRKSLSLSDMMTVTRMSMEAVDEIKDINRDLKLALLGISEIFAKKQKSTRVIFQCEESYAITIDIYSVKKCPSDLFDNSWIKELNQPDSKLDENSIPLLFCRYVLDDRSKIKPDNEKVFMRNWLDSYRRDVAEPNEATNGASMVSTNQSKETIDALVSLLQQNHHKLSNSCREQWRAASPFNTNGPFTPSFIIPLPIPSDLKASKLPENQTPCSFPSCDEHGYYKCARCQNEFYCSKAHQTEHWPIHKKECKKAVKYTEAADVANTVVVPITNSLLAGFPTATILSTRGGQATTHEPGKLAKNIHSNREFIIKIQFLSYGTPMMVYDATRSFTFDISSDIQPAYDTIYSHISTKGILGPGPNMGKAYVYATREGENLRIVTNKIAPAQPW